MPGPPDDHGRPVCLQSQALATLDPPALSRLCRRAPLLCWARAQGWARPTCFGTTTPAHPPRATGCTPPRGPTRALPRAAGGNERSRCAWPAHMLHLVRLLLRMPGVLLHALHACLQASRADDERTLTGQTTARMAQLPASWILRSCTCLQCRPVHSAGRCNPQAAMLRPALRQRLQCRRLLSRSWVAAASSRCVPWCLCSNLGLASRPCCLSVPAQLGLLRSCCSQLRSGREPLLPQQFKVPAQHAASTFRSACPARATAGTAAVVSAACCA